MDIPKNPFSEYFKESVIYIGKSKPFFFIMTSIELIELTTNLIDKITVLFRHNQIFSYKQSKLSTIVLTISPYHHFFSYMKDHSSGNFSTNRIVMIIIAFLYLVFLLYFLQKRTKKDENEENFYFIWLKRVLINFFDYFLFRLLPFYTLDVFTREIMIIAVKENHSTLDIILLFIYIVLLILISLFHIVFYNQICSWSNFKVINSYLKYYPYDNFFSSKFDTVSYFLKLLITLNQNYILCHGNYIDYIALFASFATLCIFFAFFIYTLVIIPFSSNILYFYVSFFNKVRVFYIILMAESIIFRIFLNKNEDYVPFLLYELILIILDAYLIIEAFEPFVSARVISNQYYLGVCWFIQGNDLDMQHFIAEWITYHKTQCKEIYCLICREMGDEDKDYFSDYCLNENKSITSKNILRQNILLKKYEKKKQINSNINLINQIFPPYKFSKALLKMAERTKKFMSENDLIRFDFLRIMILFLSEVSIEFHLFNELCKLIMKYKYNTNVFVSLLLIFEIIRKSNLGMIKGYDVIKKNEDLRNSLNEYIKKYENFIKFGDKSPLNYIYISNEFHNFKELVKDIHILFKKNIECNYQLLLMRYAYENLLHLQFKNTVPFDLNYYSDFLDFHYINDKIILMKYFIEHDYFLIIKGSKELLKYQGKQLSNLFPEDFESIAINKFKEQLINEEQKDMKPLFEFLIKSLNNNQNFGFIESFKMKYFIYPTNLINELFIQANYINNYVTIIIFQIIDNEEFLYGFSPQFYKIIGLTPRMNDALRKSGYNIAFNNLFTNKNVSKYEQDKNIYKFQYEKYYPFYQILLANDSLKDNINFSQIKDKINEISNMANEKKEILFLIAKKFEININYKYIIYTIKEQKRKKRGEKSITKNYSALKLDDLSGSRSEDNSQEENDNDENEFDEHFEGKGINLAASTFSSASFSGSAESTRSNLAKGKKGSKNDEKAKRAEELKRYTIIILSFGAFLIMITIIFLVLEIQQNNNFQSLFNLFETFKRFKRGVESSPLSLLTNYRYYDNNTINGTNVYEKYSELICDYNPIFKEEYLYKIVLTEIKVKYPKIMNAFENYKKSMFKLGSKVSGEISAIQGYSYSLVEDTNGLRFIKKRTNLIDLIRQYNNIIVSLLENNAFITEIFSLLNFGELKDDSRSIKLQKPLDPNENNSNIKDMLLLILMYPFIHDGLRETSHLIEKLFDNSLDNIENYLIIFYILLLVLHGFLLVICIIFLLSYIKMMKMNILSSNQLFIDKKFLEMQNKRIEQIKIMNNLYSEHPIKIAEKIEMIDDLYRKKTREDNNSTSSKKNVNLKTLTGTDNLTINTEDKKSELISKNSENISLSKNEQAKLKNNLNPSEDIFLKNDSLKSINSKIKTFNSLQDPTNKLNVKNNNNIDQITNNINYDGIVNKTLKLSNRQFKKVINRESYIIAITFSIFYIFNIIFFIFVFKSKNNMNVLIEYCDINNSIDGYIFDNINSLIYLYITNSTSEFYGQLIDEKHNINYTQEGINTLYDAVRKKNNIEKENSDLFPEVDTLVNLNCSENVIEDTYFREVFTQINVDYKQYYQAICGLFPVTSSGKDENILLEILYSVDVMYRKFIPNKFEEIYKLYVNQTYHYKMYTLTLTINRIIRTYFNEHIFTKEVQNIFNSFSYIFIIYLVLSVIFEIIIFFILNFGIISDVRKTNKLLLDFMTSLRF